jgi:hypothetical protein
MTIEYGPPCLELRTLLVQLAFREGPLEEKLLKFAKPALIRIASNDVPDALAADLRAIASDIDDLKQQEISFDSSGVRHLSDAEMLTDSIISVLLSCYSAMAFGHPYERLGS